MKILLVHSFLFPEHGGDSIYTLRLGKLLEAKGHEVGYWGMQDERNVDHRLSRFEVPSIDFESMNRKRSLINGLRVASRAIYSSAARRSLAGLLDDWCPDIVHLQSIHYHLTTSILREFKARCLPVVWTQHNLALVCCNWMLAAGSLCERCKPDRFHSPLVTRCKRGSLGASLIGSLQLQLDHRSGVYGLVDEFVAITRYYKKKFTEFGFDERKISVVTNPYEPPADTGPGPSDPEGDYLLYFGRLAPEKGVRTLVEAMPAVRRGTRLLVAGDGPERRELEALASDLAPDRIEFLGHRGADEIDRLISGCLVSVTPSIWYENFPNTIVEAFIRETPVIGADIGGIGELVQDGVRGLLFAPGNAEDLAQKINRLLGADEMRREMGGNARSFVLEELDPELHYRRLLSIYERHINN